MSKRKAGEEKVMVRSGNSSSVLEKCNKHLGNFSHLMLRQTEKLLKIYLL